MDVDFRVFLREPLRVAHQIYDRFGLTLSPDAEHEYVLRGFTVGVEQIASVFAEYRRRHSFEP